jgi:probable poly-beta-1,6-N-acetyl-D-glucosamine export protein
MENLNLVLMCCVVLFLSGFRKIFFFQNQFSIKNQRNVESGISASLGKRLEIFDVIRGVSILAVFFIHVSWFFYLYSQLQPQYAYFSLFINNISRFAIAIFFISSGILLKPVEMNKNYFIFLKHKFYNIFLPYLLIVISLEVSRGSSFLQMIYDLALGKSSVPFYFVIVLFQFYLMYPLILKHISKKLLFVSFFISLLSQFFPLTWYFLGLPIFFKYFFFFVYGVYGREKFLSGKIKLSETKIWLFLSSAYVVLSIFLPDYYFNVRLVYGIAIFNLFMIYKDKIINFKKIIKPLKWAGSLSLWLFLLHYPVMEFWFRKVEVLKIDFYAKYFLIFFLTLLICVPLAFVFDRIYSFLNNNRRKAY